MLLNSMVTLLFKRNRVQQLQNGTAMLYSNKQSLRKRSIIAFIGVALQ